jgi:eukaryotic-like serine/threonine-protein kinase
MSMAPSDDDFQGTERFELRGVLGTGGFGTVYRAYDRQGAAVVALKLLHRPEALYRFKQEFRSLADVAHGNLVNLYELMSEGGRWFFTMELIDGVDFLAYVRHGFPPRGSRDARSSRDSHSVRDGRSVTRTSPLMEGAPTEEQGAFTRFQATTQALLSTTEDAPGTAVAATVASARVNYSRLRAALVQLARGVLALHQAGKLHCDIKPSNILVSPEGRVVLLDFGLVSEQAEEGRTLDSRVFGTAPYMSPEQGSGLPLSEASDWYSVGTVLYEALTGRLPYTGSVIQVLTDKLQYDPPRPSSVAADTPEDLDALCCGLLRREPLTRLTGRELLLRLEAGPASGAPPPEVTSAGPAAPFVGRDDALAILGEAFSSARQGRATVVYVQGRSGIGKTTLLRRFLDDLARREPQAVILAGRCYERESVPYKAFDSLVDSLSQYLRSLQEPRARALLPPDVLALARLFPVLRQVGAIAAARRNVLEIPDSHELRRRAFAALRATLRHIAVERPLVLAIDDLQWGDLDSAALLAELLAPPDPPPLLLVGCYRSEDRAASPLLRTLDALPRAAGPAAELREVALAELEAAEAQDLAHRLLGRSSSALSNAIARESGGSPLLIAELVRYSEAGGDLANGPAGADVDPHRAGPVAAPVEVTLEQMIRLRIQRLAEPSRRLLEVLAVAGQPLDLRVARDAAEVQSELHGAVSSLRTGHLVRTRGADDPHVEIYHDRIREIALAQLSDGTLRSHHLRLATALEASGRADPEALAVHFHEGGRPERAAEYVVAAATRAAGALAFDRAARLYRQALELRPAGRAFEVLPLQVGLGDALANAGRGSAAADAYLEAAGTAGPQERVELQRRAADQLLRSGHVDRGLAVVRGVLEALGMRLAPTPRRALLSLLLRRLRIRLRGLGYRECEAAEIAPRDLMRIDTCWSVAVGLSLVDNIRGADFQGRHLLLALEAGEPYRVARAVALESAHHAAGGSRTRKRTQELVRKATTLAERVQHPHALALATLMSGAAAILEGRWKEAHQICERAEEALRERCTGVAWELDTARNYVLLSLLYQGEWGEVSRRLPSVLQDAQERGDLFAAIRLRARMSPAVHLAADEPARARSAVREALSAWSTEGFHIQHYHALWGELTTLLYAGDGNGAVSLLAERWPALERSFLLRIQFVRIDLLDLRARSLLASASQGGESGLLRLAASDAARLESERSRWGTPLAQLIRAGIAATRGRGESAASFLARAEKGFEGADMGLHAAVARRRRGELLGGEEGRAMIDSADAWMAARRIRNPVAVTDLLGPGTWRPGTS